MKKYTLILLCTLFAIYSYSQEDAAYLNGAVPEVNGKVLFQKSIETNGAVSDTELYNKVLQWAKEKYNGVEEDGLLNRVLLEDPESLSIACGGEHYLVFRDVLLILDRSKTTYQLILKIKDGKCEATIRNIKYAYEEEENIPAEKMIVDEVAFNKDDNKLNFHYGKFRKRTVDMVEDVFGSIDAYLRGEGLMEGESSDIPKKGVSEREKNAQQAEGTMPGYRTVSKNKISVRQLNSWTLVSSGRGNTVNAITALWGGTGAFGDNVVAFSLLNSTNGAVEIMDKEDTYAISFYTDIYADELEKFSSLEGSIEDKIKASGLTPIQTPSGATSFGEAWMIIECKKGTAQPAPATSGANVNGMDKNNYKQTYIGEIVNIWVK